MKLSVGNIPSQTMARLLEAIANARQQGTYLAVHRSNLPPFNLWLIGAGILFVLLALIANEWLAYYWYVGAGTCLAYSLARQFQKWWRWRRLGKDAVFFDPLYFISIIGGGLEVLPLSHFNEADISLAAGGSHYIARFYFRESFILVPCFSKNDESTLRFQSALRQHCSVMRHSAVSQDSIQHIHHTLAEKIIARRAPLISAAFALILLWFILPITIDRNQYLFAKKKNTATAYREYLADLRNLKYREIARADIKNLYDLYIQKYQSRASASAGTNAFAQVVEFLRDKNLFTVRMLFFPRSELIDLPQSKEFHIIPVTPSFSPDKNQARQEGVISAVKASLGQMFPTDILTIASEESAELPRLEVYYTYRNNPKSIYYPVKEEHLPDRSRTWYYGIEVDWWFRISLPTQSDPIYDFNLVSRPAQQFNSESSMADAVYTNMALSAFNDFETEFHKQFLNWQ